MENHELTNAQKLTREAAFVYLLEGPTWLEEFGAKEIVMYDFMPLDIDEESRQLLLEAGAIFGETYDELFMRCQLPDGWTKALSPLDPYKRTINIFDQDNKLFGHIFYKNSRQDRYAHFFLNKNN